jgi:DNA-binding transcriptional LysR family regulator
MVAILSKDALDLADDGRHIIMAFTLRQLNYFVVVAEHGSVSHAARTLSISQSAITEAVKELEADLGAKLFERHSRGLNITHDGHQFLRHASAILGNVSSARLAFSSQRDTVSGDLHLGVTSLMAGYVLSDLLAKFRRVNPQVNVTAIEDNGEYLEHLLIGGELDVAVMITSNLREKSALHVEILDVSPFRLWLPLGHPLSQQESITLADVAREPLIMLNMDEMEKEAVNAISALMSRPNIAFRTRSVEAVRSLVATGAGVAVLPDLIYRPWSLEGDKIDARDVSGELPVVKVGIVWRKGSPLPESAREFIAIAQAHQSQKDK